MTAKWFIALILVLCFSNSEAQPMLVRNKNWVQLMVNDQPFLILGGELGLKEPVC